MCNKKIFIYVGSANSNEKGAVGTHTKGILKAFVKNNNIEKSYFIGTDLYNFHSIDDLELIDVKHNFETDINFINKIKSHKRFSAKLIFELKKLIEKYADKDIIIYHRYSLLISSILIKEINKLKNARIKTLLEYNDLTSAQLISAANNKMWSALSSFIRVNKISLKILENSEKYCFVNVSSVICITHKLKEYVDSLDPNINAIVVNNAVDEEFILKYTKADKTNLRRKLNVDFNKFILCFVGTLTVWEGFNELLSALSKTKNIKNIQLIIVGLGFYKDELIAMTNKLNIVENVKFIEALEFKEAIEYVYIADLIPILKTINSYQVSSMKYYEAMGLGKYIMASDIEYINNVEKDGVGTVVSFPLAIDEIAVKIDKLYEIKNEIEGKENFIRTFALQNHTWAMRVSQILNSI